VQGEWKDRIRLAAEDFASYIRWAAEEPEGDLGRHRPSKPPGQLIDLKTVISRGGKIAEPGIGLELPALTLAPAFASVRGSWARPAARRRDAVEGEAITVPVVGEMVMDPGLHFPSAPAGHSYSAISTVPVMPPEVREVATRHLPLMGSSEMA